MTEAEARRLAAAEGLALVQAESAAGYKGVSYHSRPGISNPFMVKIKQGGKSHSLGCFSSAAEAALAYARHLGPAELDTARQCTHMVTVKEPPTAPDSRPRHSTSVSGLSSRQWPDSGPTVARQRPTAPDPPTVRAQADSPPTVRAQLGT